MNRDRLYLTHILESIERIQSYAGVDRATFMTDSMRRDAVVRNFEIMGEATKRLSDSAKRRRP